MSAATSPGREVRVIHDTALARWEVGFADALGTTLLLGDGTIRVGRDGSGQVVEVVIDAERIDDLGLSSIRMAFGEVVADLVGSLGPDDVDLRIGGGRPGAAATGVAPVPAGSDRFTVPTETGDVELRVDRGMLRFRLPGAVGSSGSWVRVSSADSGALLALAPIVDDPAGGDPVAEVVFGLRVDPTRLTISISTDPLGRDSTGARGPDSGSAQPGRTIIEARLRRRGWLIAAVAIAALLVIALVLAAVRNDPEGSPIAAVQTTTTDITTPDASTTTVFVDPGPGDPGPVTFTYPEGDRVSLVVEGVQPTAVPGASIELTVRATAAEFGGYGPGPGETVAPADVPAAEESARQNCLNVRGLDAAGRWNLMPSSIGVRLVRVSPAPVDGIDPERILLPAVDLVGEPESMTTDEQSCREAELTSTGFNALTYVRRAAQTVPLELPVGMAPGLWEVIADLDGQPGTAEGRLRLRIESAE